MSPFLASILTIIISVVLSGFVAWFLDKRKEKRSSKKYETDRDAVIDFLRKLPSLRKDQQKVSEFFDALGQHRSLRISAALSAMKLCKIVPLAGGRQKIALFDGFNSRSETDIKQMMSDVQKGIYDGTFENSPSS
ncbi:MAG: hypothetical protein ABSG21_15705 [Spirochaetia bacterium]|jgi:hypothetical protein